MGFAIKYISVADVFSKMLMKELPYYMSSKFLTLPYKKAESSYFPFKVIKLQLAHN